MDALMKFLAASYPPMQIACAAGRELPALRPPDLFATGKLGDLRPSTPAPACAACRHLHRDALVLRLGALAHEPRQHLCHHPQCAAACRTLRRAAARRARGPARLGRDPGRTGRRARGAESDRLGFRQPRRIRGTRLRALLGHRRRDGAHPVRDREDGVDGLLVPADARPRRGRARGTRLGSRSPRRTGPGSPCSASPDGPPSTSSPRPSDWLPRRRSRPSSTCRLSGARRSTGSSGRCCRPGASWRAPRSWSPRAFTCSTASGGQP